MIIQTESRSELGSTGHRGSSTAANMPTRMTRSARGSANACIELQRSSVSAAYSEHTNGVHRRLSLSVSAGTDRRVGRRSRHTCVR